MAMTTRDVEADVIAKLAALLPTEVFVSGASQNALAGPMRPTQRAGVHEVFVQVYGGTRDVHNDGVIRTFSVQVTVRSAQNDYDGGHAFALRIHDALDLLGPWTGTSGQAYMDVSAVIASPNHLGSDEDQELFAEAFDVLAETLRT
jgi:hypothetical protein